MNDDYTEQARLFEERVVEEIYHRGNLGVIDMLYAQDHISHPSGGPSGGRHVPPEELKRKAHIAREAFPDVRVEIGQFMAVRRQGSLELAYHYTFTGTHRGQLGGLPPTGRRVSVSGMCMSRMVGGKYVESWEAADGLHLARQLGFSLEQRSTTSRRPASAPPAAGVSGSSSWRQQNGWSDLSLLAALAAGWIIGEE